MPDELPQRTSITEVEQIRQTLDGLTRIKTRAEILTSGRERFAVISRKALMSKMLEIVEVFVNDRIRQAENQLRQVLEERQESARNEGRHRVLSSFAEFTDLLDTTLEMLTAEESKLPVKALDQRVDRIFKSYGFERIPTVGEPFDPTFHEALEERPSEEHGPGIILQEVSRGYRAGTFVLRAARVIVST